MGWKRTRSNTRGCREQCVMRLCETAAWTLYLLLMQYTQQSEPVGDLTAHCKALLQGKLQSVTNTEVVKRKTRKVYV